MVLMFLHNQIVNKQKNCIRIAYVGRQVSEKTSNGGLNSLKRVSYKETFERRNLKKKTEQVTTRQLGDHKYEVYSYSCWSLA